MPGGFVTGAICGSGGIKSLYNKDMKEQIEKIIVPIYFEENDQNNSTQFFFWGQWHIKRMPTFLFM